MNYYLHNSNNNTVYTIRSNNTVSWTEDKYYPWTENKKSGELKYSFDIPGYTKDNIRIEVSDKDISVNANNIVRGIYTCIVTIPETLDAETVSAKLENGVLTLTAKTLEKSKNRLIKIE